ncbi:MAG: 3-phosphoshikimate 1-carboxyvinyltransferase [Planctomycetales bacterium]|nr:3-phosphoshikimate 1-carboxyvinyltransferase [Planctomycetales bacterium]
MSSVYRVKPITGPLNAVVRPPGSKSITNRALVCAALAEGTSRLTGALDSDDTRVMIEGLAGLGIGVERSNNHTLVVTGCDGQIPAMEADLLVGNSGTTVRFLTAMLTLGHGAFRLSGVPRMHERPIGDLAAALNQLGAKVSCESPGGCPPVTIHANGLPGGSATVRGEISSQFLSGLLMAAPCARDAVELAVEGELVSKPYVAMTLAVMREFGVEAVVDPTMQNFSIRPQSYQARDYAIEPDASAASYFWAAAAIVGGRVQVDGLSPNSLQGDVRFVDCLETMGCRVERGGDYLAVESHELRGAVLDMNDISDTAQTLAAVALFAEGPTTITGIGHNRHKESDRIGDLARELRKLGAEVAEHEDGFTVTPDQVAPSEIETYDDHRMAMSMALVGLRVPGVVILDPGCTSKTYPRFFEDLDRLKSGA